MISFGLLASVIQLEPEGDNSQVLTTGAVANVETGSAHTYMSIGSEVKV